MTPVGRRRSRIGSVALAVVVALVVFVAGAQAAGTTQTLNISLKGTSTPKTIINTPVFACDICWPDGSGTTDYLGVQGSVDMTVGWEAPSTIDVNWLPGDVRQGSKLNVGDTLTNNPGDLKVTYTATVVAGHFSDDGTGIKPVSGDTISPSVSVDDTASCAIPLPGESPRTCSKRTEIHITDFNFFDIVLAKIFLVINTDFTVSSDGVVTVRSVTVSNGTPIPDANLKWDQISPQTLTDPIFFSCQQPVGAETLYDLKGIGTNISGDVAENVNVNVKAFIPAIDLGINKIFDGDLIPGGIDVADTAFDPFQVTAPDQEVDLGAIQPNQTPPTVAMGPIPTNGTEGSPIALSVVGTGAGGSFSNCDPTGNSLDYAWSFDDGGTAFGKSVNHPFPDNFLGGSAPRTGHVVVTDPTGLKTTLDFSVPVANVPPTVSAGPDKTALWGVPVSFHGNGSDAGPVDNGTLLYAWDFGDPFSLVGASGQDASHTYTMPSGTTPYLAQVTVTDNDGVTGTGTVNVSILKHGTTTSYTGPLKSTPSKNITLTASLVDQLNQPVSGRSILFTLGSQSIIAQTNSSGVAMATIKLNQKQGSYPVSATFAGTNDSLYLGSASSTQTFTIGP